MFVAGALLDLGAVTGVCGAPPNTVDTTAAGDAAVVDTCGAPTGACTSCAGDTTSVDGELSDEVDKALYAA